jgi:lipoate-protein ligase A
MSLNDVAIGLSIDIEKLYERLGIPKEVPITTKLKDVSAFVPGLTDEKAKEILENEVEEETLDAPKILRGSMTLDEVAKTLNIYIKDLYIKINIPESVPTSTRFNQVSNLVPGFDFEKMKETLEKGYDNSLTQDSEEIVAEEKSKIIIKLKGSMTLEEIAETLKIDIKDLYKRLNIPENVPMSTRFNKVSKIVPGFDFEKEKSKLENN